MQTGVEPKDNMMASQFDWGTENYKYSSTITLYNQHS